jgi:hypothetical protein
MITGKLYDWLKWIAQIVLPGLGTLYFTLAGIWGLPNAEEIVGTVMAVDLFLGLLLGISQVQYNKGVAQGGDFNVFEGEDGSLEFSMALEAEPEELAKKKELRFDVKKKKPRRRRPRA